mgnify:CR=1 FL=1
MKNIGVKVQITNRMIWNSKQQQQKTKKKQKQARTNTSNQRWQKPDGKWGG